MANKTNASGTDWDLWFSADNMDRCVANVLMQRDAKPIKKAYKKHSWLIVCRTRGTTHFKKKVDL